MITFQKRYNSPPEQRKINILYGIVRNEKVKQETDTPRQRRGEEIKLKITCVIVLPYHY